MKLNKGGAEGGGRLQGKQRKGRRVEGFFLFFLLFVWFLPFSSFALLVPRHARASP